tara:strand:+ start:2089 stop:2298 length:210 start_codon:yes stop_codon:yes gene_type:complete
MTTGAIIVLIVFAGLGSGSWLALNIVGSVQGVDLTGLLISWAAWAMFSTLYWVYMFRTDFLAAKRRKVN